MSPEQAQGKAVDPRSDIFAFGAVLYEMATGKRAFDGSDTISTLTAVIRDHPRPMLETHPSVPPELEQIVQRCLRKDPADRWQSMAEIHQALVALRLRIESGSLYPQHIPAMTPAQPPAPAPAPPARKTWMVVAGLACLAAGGAGGGLWYWTHKPKPAPPPLQVAEVTPQPPPPAPPADRALRNDDVIAMVTGKVPARLIMSQIRASKTQFNLSSGEIIRMVKAGVPETVIEVMRDPSKAPPAVESPAGKNTAQNKIAAPVRPAAKPVLLPDGTPMLLVLKEVPPNNAPDGTPLRFEVAGDVVVGGLTVIARGAAAGGRVSREKRSFGRSRAAYLMVQVESVDGKQLRLRTTSSPAKDMEAARRPMLPPGTHYPAYLDGDASITVR
jgi:serine/threonine-protein kinase